jgi:prepilin-type N-terminal cleavage/methylation domain-containing protein
MAKVSGQKPAFTLIEIMIVVSIISILVGILLPIISIIRKKAQITATKVAVNVCHVGCAKFSNDHQRFPWPRQVELQAILSGAAPEDGALVTYKIYAELRGNGTLNSTVNYIVGLKPRFIGKTTDGHETLVDWWGRELQFRVSPQTNEVVVYSLGVNGLDETSDSPSPDPASKPSSYYLYTSGNYGDDIVFSY